MDIIHRIGVNADERDRAELASLGIEVNTGMVAFDLSEADDRWPAIASWVARRRPSDVVRTEFTSSELDAASWLAVVPDWHHGYPQPEANFAFRNVTYDLTEYCLSCGTGARQVHPFRMTREPNWGRRSILQLNWVFDEYFIRPDLWRSAFEPLGLGSMPVLDRKGSSTLTTIVQLVIDGRVPVNVSPLPPLTCADCGRPKYRPVNRGPKPAPRADPTEHLVRSEEWFGDGPRAFNLVIASQALHRAVRDSRATGANFEPVR
jgi:hypothetical protein